MTIVYLPSERVTPPALNCSMMTPAEPSGWPDSAVTLPVRVPGSAALPAPRGRTGAEVGELAIDRTLIVACFPSGWRHVRCDDECMRPRARHPPRPGVLGPKAIAPRESGQDVARISRIFLQLSPETRDVG